MEHAREQGFSTVSLADVYEEHDQGDLQIAAWDNHPNAQAHKLVSELLYQRLIESDLAPELEGPPRATEGDSGGIAR